MSQRVIEWLRQAGQAIARLGPGQPSILVLGLRSLTLTQRGERVTVPLAEPLRACLPGATGLAGLASALDQLPTPPGPLAVTVSDALCRAWVVVRPAGLANPAEIEALARLELGALFAERPECVGDWEIRIDATPFATHWPAFAMPKPIHAAVTSWAAQRKVSIVSFQPALVRALAAQPMRWIRARFSRRPLACVRADAESVTIALRQGSDWVSVRSLPALSDLETDLETLVRRECLGVAIAPEVCRIARLPAEMA